MGTFVPWGILLARFHYFIISLNTNLLASDTPDTVLGAANMVEPFFDFQSMTEAGKT